MPGGVLIAAGQPNQGGFRKGSSQKFQCYGQALAGQAGWSHQGGQPGHGAEWIVGLGADSLQPIGRGHSFTDLPGEWPETLNVA